jgi:hypothetical protein
VINRKEGRFSPSSPSDDGDEDAWQGSQHHGKHLKDVNINMDVESPIPRAMMRTSKSAIETVANQQLVTTVNSVHYYCVKTLVPQVLQPGHYLLTHL